MAIFFIRSDNVGMDLASSACTVLIVPSWIPVATVTAINAVNIYCLYLVILDLFLLFLKLT